MSTGTKIFLAVFAAFIGVLVVYYGVLLPEAQTLPELNAAARDVGKPVADADAAAAHNPTHDLTSMNAPAPVAPVAGITSDGGFRFDLPLLATANEPEQQPAADPLANQPLSNSTAVQPQPETPQATPPPSSPPVQSPPAESQPVTPVVSPPIANQPVSLPGSSKRSSSSGSTARHLQPPPTSDYLVKSGDTMSSIAEAWFGDANKWSLIAKENPNVDPARLSIGQKLRLPSKDATPAPAPVIVKEQPASSSPSTSGSHYTVRSGDTLAKIAREQFSDVAKWKAIYDLNKSVIGSDPAAIKPGMKLKLPPKT